MKSVLKQLSLLLLFFILASTTYLSAQELKTITPDDYDKWQNLYQTVISPDGNWVAYILAVNEEDDTLFVTNVKDNKEYKYPFSTSPRFSMNSEWVAFTISYPEKELEKMREKKETIKNKMGLLNLKTGKKETFKDVSQFSFSENGFFIAMKIYKPKDKKSKGADLVVRDLKTGKSRNIGNVSEYVFNKKGDRLAYIIDADEQNGNGVELFNLNNYTINILESDTSDFSKLIWDKKGNALAYLHSFKDTSFKENSNKVVVFRNIYNELKKEVFDPALDTNFPDSIRISEEFRPVWAEDLSAVFFGIKEWTAVEKPDKKKKDKEEGEDNEKEKEKPKIKKDEKLPGLDIWHWKDNNVQPRQKITYNRDINLSYLCAWNVSEKKFVQLADKNNRYAYLTGDQKHAYLEVGTPYEPALTVEYNDYYLVNTKTGVKKNILEKFSGYFRTSPDGKYLLYFKEKNWWTYDVYGDKHVNLTGDIEADFWNTRYDGPSPIMPPYGAGGWIKDDKEILLYDEYNVWYFKPDGSGYILITDGNPNEIQFRFNRLDYEEDYIDPEQNLYFRAYGDKTKKFGYYRIKPGKKIEELIFEDKNYSSLQKAKSADKYIYNVQTYVESPNVFFVESNFKNPKQISETNPQQKDFLWGKSELIDFENSDGKKMQGALFYPANYEPGKKYPMIVYIYEINSHRLHNYTSPSRKSSYNTTNYTSQGYFIFMPDIVYKINQPGQSAVDCVVPAVKKLIETGKIDEKKIGLMGHSWGAYQTSFIITQTDIFSAGVAGAPLIDLVSMYNEIYWNSGTPNQQIFEVSQGRFNQPFWKIQENYLDNSPLYNAEDINTPLLITFGDKDGAVDWHQGIEMYITMRRMQKPLIMLVYADENHGLRKDENRLDYTTKVNEFFNFYLLGSGDPEWIQKGVTYIDKKKEEEKQDKK